MASPRVFWGGGRGFESSCGSFAVQALAACLPAEVQLLEHRAQPLGDLWLVDGWGGRLEV